ncbi:uncharacterized protein EAE97_001455 [Botrytis byssoidea]|uniref:Uncharacterized protein n=1 Tax=Botrytis byssoidea TaxID=139641 RepID=A0A9P5IUJ1_9HELO|nr:uncharacterized protein EAE97_001455 [Botrytis byssoidea]KAF7954057.1 hypothetical protein EAE97_001455 [Botrytis byssoidea]
MADLTSNDSGHKSEETISPHEQEASEPLHGTQVSAPISVEQWKDESLKSLEIPQESSSNTGDTFEDSNERQPNYLTGDTRPTSSTGVKQDGETSDTAKSLVGNSAPLNEKSPTATMEIEVPEKEDGHEHNDGTESLWKPSPETNERLLVAARYGDKEEVERALGEGAEIETRNQYGETALHLACRFDHKNIAPLLLAEGANIEARDNDRWTPLISAMSEEASIDILEHLFNQEKPSRYKFQERHGANCTKSLFDCKIRTESAEIIRFLYHYRFRGNSNPLQKEWIINL